MRDGLLPVEIIKDGLGRGFITAENLIDKISEYNKADAKKAEVDREPIIRVGLTDDKGNTPLKLSADQMACAKGLVFITDGKGAKEA